MEQTTGLQELIDYNDRMRSRLNEQTQAELNQSPTTVTYQLNQSQQSDSGMGGMPGLSSLISSVAGQGGSTAGGGAASGAAGGSASGIGAGLAAAGPWAALAALGVGQDIWARKKGLRDGEKFKGEYALTGRSAFKDAPYYAEKADKVIPGMGGDIKLASAFSSPVDIVNGKGFKRAKEGLKESVVGKLLRKVF